MSMGLIAAGLGLGGLSSLGKPSGGAQASLDQQRELASVQTQAEKDRLRRLNEFEELIKGLTPLSGEAKNDLIRLFPGKQTDFSGVRGTGDLQLLQALLGAPGPSTSAVNQAAALGQQDTLSGQQQVTDISQLLAMILLGKFGGGFLT